MSSISQNLADAFEPGIETVFAQVPEGFSAALLARAVEDRRGPLVFVARDGLRAADVETALAFYAPDLEVLQIPAWDCLPYDRVSPNADVSARRVTALAELAEGLGDAPRLIITTANALMQKVPPRAEMAGQAFRLTPGVRVDMDVLIRWLENNGFLRVSTVRDTGEYAVRGGILDLYPPALDAPVRLDFFGDTLETVRSFDAETQRTLAQLKRVDLVPMSEIVLTPDAIARFRRNYISTFGAAKPEDTLYQAISEGRRHPGMEHWLPLFHEALEPLSTYFGEAPVLLDHLAREAIVQRFDQALDHYEARQATLEAEKNTTSAPYLPVDPSSLYLSPDDMAATIDGPRGLLTPFEPPEGGAQRVLNLGGRIGRSFAAERSTAETNVFDALIKHAAYLRKAGMRVVIACWSEGSRDRFAEILAEHGLERVVAIDSYAEIDRLETGVTALVVLGVESGFETDSIAVIGEQDVLGDRLVRRKGKRRGKEYIQEVSSLSAGDLVVHVDHGIARFVGLKTIDAAGAPHDCLELHYFGDDKLFLPVENIELLSRYGSEEVGVQLDRLGGASWQNRKARLKKKILEMAGDLIAIAAARELKRTEPLTAPDGLYGEFAAHFPYSETEDQLGAIEAVLEDLSSGRPMDRLVCGDVGFGKTEVALRGAFVAAMAGRQVAVVVPTTLLARQHFKTFEERFKGLPVTVRHASRLVSTKSLNETKKGMADGSVDIVVGTHALLAKNIQFRDLGLLILDEEQRFGVKHKERLKELRNDVHVLTLSATPIPRTLQLAMTGVRELSLITTAPVDRLAVRTFVAPFDSLTIREALLRERYRGGQSFFVAPRISDLEDIQAFLKSDVPELKVAIAHGQMPPGELDDLMNAFYDGQYDVLLSTTIVESGLDIPSANTLVIWRADMFGLAQLYQLKGRVGRSKTRAFAYFTLPANKMTTPQAQKRLRVLQSLEGMGAGFQLASHDLDMRGAGNLLGEEQSGHVKEVGFELYQSMLEEAVATLKEGDADGFHDDGKWSPQITVGTPVLIPEDYVPDLTVRMGLYRRLADLPTPREIDAFAAELVDRFGGPLPEEVDGLLKIVYIKQLCLKANVESLNAGPKGAVIKFRNGEFPDPAALIGYIGQQGSLAKVRPDQSVVFIRDWATPEKRLKGSAVVMTNLVKLLG
ncbi:MAG: transcription-repair coupling factor [Pseudomonadota bacterium]